MTIVCYYTQQKYSNQRTEVGAELHNVSPSTKHKKLQSKISEISQMDGESQHMINKAPCFAFAVPRRRCHWYVYSG